MERTKVFGELLNSDIPVDEKTLANEEIEGITQLDEFAKAVNNWSYNYEADNPDGIDPDKRFSGPMAQELQQIPGYDVCIVTDADGTLRVDTDRLALTLAGTLADVAKRLIALEDWSKTLENAMTSQEA